LITRLYIQKTEKPKLNPANVKNEYIETYKKLIENEEEMKQLLIEGGHLDE
jgi:hypothetical protein